MNMEVIPPPAPAASPAARISPARAAVVKTRSVSEQFVHCLIVAGLAVLSYLVISHYFLQTVEVVGASMVPTLRNADHYFLNRWVFHMRAPQRGDIVVIKDPTDGSFAVKRVIALPGETVYFKDGKVLVNGQELKEPYLGPRTPTFTGNRIHEEMISCGDNRFFVMGDNRNHSFDSRMYGPVPKQNILGLVMR